MDIKDDKPIKKEHPFCAGNKLGGKPLGTRNKTTLMLESLGADNAEEITRVVIEMARKGDLSAAKIILDRMWPVPKPSTYVTRKWLADVHTQSDINKVMTEVLNDISNGIISLEEGEQLTRVIEKKSQSIQSCMHEELEGVRVQLEKVKREGVV